MKRFLYISLATVFFPIALIAIESTSPFALFDDLALVEKINQEMQDELPFLYNFSMIGGYYNMPSARMPKMGRVGIGAARVTPYNVYGISFQPFSRLELSANYRVYKGMIDKTIGSSGFGDEAERIGNLKIGILMPEDGFSGLPSIAFGADDFFGTGRFNSQYGVMTKTWTRYNFEASLGWGHGRMKGFFGGFAWSPWRKSDVFFLKEISLIAEYDNFNYKKHPHEHPDGREVKSRINLGATYVGWDMLQLSVTSLRGSTLGASASFRYPLGSTQGLFAKVDDPGHYVSPIDTEPLGLTRPEDEFTRELVYAFGDQGLDLYTVYIGGEGETRRLWLKVVNNRYREEEVVRARIQDLLSALIPSDIKTVTVVVEADALPCQAYVFRTEDLQRFRLGFINKVELAILSPMREVIQPPPDSREFFQKRKDIWTFTFRPRLLTFFGSASGKFKYNVGLIASPEGYLFDQLYYKVLVGYSIHSTMWSMSDIDRLNPSQLLNVRTDTIRYYQNNSVSLEKAFIQKGVNLGKGWFFRIAGGYFEPAYGGLATEFLLYPVNCDWAVGVEAATVMKRRYEGIAFTHKIRKLSGMTPEYVHYLGVQYFLNLYYKFRPLQLEFRAIAGQFLAKDKGVRFEATRTFTSGLRLTLWYTVTNGHDHVNGSLYYDKGFAFVLPLDVFLKQSSRNYVGYAMSAWLRDVGAIAETGKQLYMTLRDERNN